MLTPNEKQVQTHARCCVKKEKLTRLKKVTKGYSNK